MPREVCFLHSSTSVKSFLVSQNKSQAAIELSICLFSIFCLFILFFAFFVSPTVLCFFFFWLMYGQEVILMGGSNNWDFGLISRPFGNFYEKNDG